MQLGIPKNLGHIWIGPIDPPSEWMNTWKEKHPDWKYTLYNNDFLNSYHFKTQHLIQEYLRRKQYAGVADLMRYEILYEYGGFLAPADSICYHNISELFSKECAYTVYENEMIRGKLVSPILACEPRNEFLCMLIDELSRLSIHDLDDPWRTTGNLFVVKMIEKYNPNIHIFPSHYFIPVHFEGIIYEEEEKVYAKQLFGSTHNSYNELKRLSYIARKIDKLKKKQLNKENESIREYFKNKRIQLFNIDFSNNHEKE